MNVKVIYNSSVPPMLANADGITLYPFIFIRFSESDERTPILLKHELIHIEQIYRMGVIKFYLTYIWYWLRYGYRDNPYEVEAYNRETE